MTYTQLRTQRCSPVDAILNKNDYVSEVDCDMRRWLTESCQKGLPPIEDRAAEQSLAGRCTVGIELCTPTSKFSFSSWHDLRIIWQQSPSLCDS